jgi:hypothetical protein
MVLTDVRFQDGYEKLIEIRDFLITQMDFKGLQELTKSLFEDLDYYRRMADFHAPLGLTDDARRVRRLEKELGKINEFLSEFSFLSLGRDGSIITNRIVTIDEVESVFNRLNNSFGNVTITNPNQSNEDNKLENLIMKVDELTRKTANSEPSLAKQIIIGLLINFISSFVIPSSASEDHTYILNNSIENHYHEVQVNNYEPNILLCNNLILRKESSNDAQIVTRLHGMLVLKVISEEKDWILVEYNDLGNSIKGWMQRDSIIPSKE